jgi:hypothetical protein
MNQTTSSMEKVTHGDAPLGDIVVYSTIFFVILYLVFSRNVACLLFGLDGTRWVVEFASQAGRAPFSQVGANPLQGSFDAYYPAFREYFVPEALALLLSGVDAGKVVTYTAYGVVMVLATQALSRSVGLPRTVGFLAGTMFAMLALPTNLSDASWLYGIYNLVPHLAQVVCVAVALIACFWGMELRRPVLMVTLGLTAVALTVLSFASFVTMTILMLPAVTVYGGASIFASKRLVDALARIAAAAMCIAVPAAIGMIKYAIAVGGYTAYNFFDAEFMQTRDSPYFASILFQNDTVGKLLVIVGLIGAVTAAATGPRKLKAFALAHIAATLAFLILAQLIVRFAVGYHGPSPLYFEFVMWPIMCLFAAFAAAFVCRHAVEILQSAFSTGWRLDLIPRRGLLLAVPLFLLTWNAVALAKSRPANCTLVGFYPVRPNAITDRLKDTIATAVGAPFRGLAATFNGAQGRGQLDWFSLHAGDNELWRRLGNDLRLVGLWWYNIPTLTQYSPLVTPPYYLLLTEFLSRPTDRQVRSALVLSQPNERVLKLWGVRFIITDFDPGFGQPEMTIAVAGENEIHLAKLADTNLGDYSPTEVRQISNFREGLGILHELDFDGKRTVVSEHQLVGPFVAADDAKLVYQRTGFSLHAFSNGRSILVLPVQYSRCWSASGNGDPVLFRANLMQLGISFSGALDANLVFRFGPFSASECRIEDIKDMTRLGIREARSH